MTEISSSTSPQLSELVRLTRRFGVLLNMGTTAPAALCTLEMEASPAFCPLIAHIAERMGAGGTLTEALADFPELVPAIYRDWVRSGEDVGAVDVGALEIAELLEPLAAGGGDLLLGWQHIAEAVTLIQVTRRCAELLEKGLEWWRVLYLLQYEAPPAFAHFIEDLLPKRNDERGLLTLWQRMEEHPQIFSPFYRAIVRLGWETRTMDEMMRCLADLLYEDWSLARRLRCYPERASLIIDHGAPAAASWDALSAPQRQLITVVFCHAAALLLAAGYDQVEVLATCALLLPAAQQQALHTLPEHDDLVVTLDALGCFSPFVLTLLTSGQSRGRLEFAFTQAATVLRAEMQ